MSKYKQIQFIGYEISTSPRNPVFDNGMIISGEYVGIDNIEQDIEQRCQLMMDAINTANNNRTIPSDDGKTLKLFMSPEFFFRGPKGAYEMDQVHCVIAALQKMIKADDWKDWMFVFGSIVGNSRLDQSDWLLQFEEEELFREIYNVVLIQQGGFEDDLVKKEDGARIVMKEFKSDIDFILKPTQGISLSQTTHMPSFAGGEGKEEQLHNYDGLGIFKLNEITMGVEVCLDHLAGRLKGSPQLPGKDMIAFQLIPSCGMDIRPYNVVAQTDGYSFNVDGRTVPNSSLKKVFNDKITNLNVSSEKFSVEGLDEPPVVEIDAIFADGSGVVRVYDLVSIPNQQVVTGSYKTFYHSAFYNSETQEENKYVFHYLVEYDEKDVFRAAYMSVSLKEYRYELDRVLLPVSGELFRGQIKLDASIMKVKLDNGDDRIIFIDFSCQGDRMEGAFISFKSVIK